jgi:hypothetical protein
MEHKLCDIPNFWLVSIETVIKIFKYLRKVTQISIDLSDNLSIGGVSLIV